MKQLKINTLGDFSISCGNKTLTESNRRSRNAWTLLEYLITRRGKEVSSAELIDLFYDDSKNPASALKTQINRIREMLDTLGCASGKELLVSRMGGYEWAPPVNCVIDADKFESLCKQASSMHEDKDGQLETILRAIEMYTGDYLPSQAGEAWAIPIISYYHTLFIRAVYMACDLLLEKKRLSELITICQRAVIIDPYDEKIHISLIHALAESGNVKDANKYYLYAIDMFYNQLGVNPSDEFMTLYEETIKTLNETEVDIDTVMEYLDADTENVGAFQCEYDFFKHIYKLESRASIRDGRNIFISIITLSEDKKAPLNLKKQNLAMEKLGRCVKYSLRSSDIFARLSLSQYIVLLTTSSIDTADMVMTRILKRFRHDNPKTHVVLNYNLKNIHN